jgi:hypothetical protein
MNKEKKASKSSGGGGDIESEQIELMQAYMVYRNELKMNQMTWA